MKKHIRWTQENIIKRYRQLYRHGGFCCKADVRDGGDIWMCMKNVRHPDEHEYKLALTYHPYQRKEKNR
jgi:hypothetical protein